MKHEVDVVLSSADGQHAHVMVLADSREVSPQAGLQFLFNDFAAILGAKDYVHVVFRECVRQCVAPFAVTRYRGLMLSHLRSQGFHHPTTRKVGVCWGPRFRPGLRVCRPFGT